PNSKPGAVLGSVFCGFRGTQADGRVYNLYLRNNNGAMLKDLNSLGTGGREIYGAFYRLHQVQGSYTRTASIIDPPDGGPLVEPLVPQCVDQRGDPQIGCLAAVSKCSIGLAARRARLSAAGQALVDAIKVDALYPTDTCVQKLLTDLP